MILNMTQHAASAEQKAAGTVDLAGADGVALRRLLTFEQLPNAEEIKKRADAIADLAAAHSAGADGDRCMIGGAPFLIPALAEALRRRGLVPVCAFSRRESVDEDQADGSVVKRSVFRHLGFVDLP